MQWPFRLGTMLGQTNQLEDLRAASRYRGSEGTTLVPVALDGREDVRVQEQDGLDLVTL